VKKCKMTIYKKINKKIRLCSSRAVLVIQAIEQMDKANLPVSTTIISENQMYKFI